MPASPGELLAQERTAQIYVVDDEPMVGEVLQAILRIAGFEAHVFQEPLFALHSLAQAHVRPLLLLTDFAMGPMNGIELIRACKLVSPELKTILISSSVAPEDAQTGGIAPDRFLGKPFQPRMLLDMVRELLAIEP